MRRLAVLVLIVLIVLVLGLGQLLLPGIAAQRLRDRLAASGSVLSVKVAAFPAVKLLWHDADHVTIRMRQYRSSPGELGGLLQQAGAAGTIDATAGEVDSGLLTLRDAALHKRGTDLNASARVTEADLRAAVPFLDGVQPVASNGGVLTLRGTATLLGFTATVDATLAAQDGRLVVTPNLPLGGLATVTVFSNQALDVQTVGASLAPGGFSVSAAGRLR
jgi:DUF2993 family protein